MIGLLWAPSMAMLSDGADAVGLEQGLAFGLMNLTWATGQSLGDIGGARLGEAAGDEVAYLLLSAICVAAFLVLRARPVRRPATACGRRRGRRASADGGGCRRRRAWASAWRRGVGVAVGAGVASPAPAARRLVVGAAVPAGVGVGSGSENSPVTGTRSRTTPRTGLRRGRCA